MSNKTGFLILFCVIYFSAITPIILAQILSDGDCLDYTSFDFFRQSPGGYDSSMEMDGKLCTALCANVWMPYAGVVSKRHCLCAYEHDRAAIENIPKVNSELCDTSDDYTRYFEGKVIHPITDLSISPSSEETQVDEEVNFDISIGSGEDVEFSVDFGDGTDPTEWSSETGIKHRYYVPGHYMIAVYARQPAYLKRRVVSEISWIQIITELQNENVEFNCPRVVEPGDPVLCNLTITSGQRLEMSVDFSDGSSSPLISLPDIQTKSLGVSVPQYPNSGIKVGTPLKAEDLLIIPISEKALDTLGAIQAFEGYCSTAGKMDIYILRKVCQEGSDCSGQSISCFEPSALCVSNKGCSDSCMSFPNNKADYGVVKNFSLTITEGHFYLKTASRFRMIAGDLIAIRSEGAQLAHRLAKKNEILDYKYEQTSDNATTLSSEKFKAIKGIKHLIRIVVSEPLELTVPHQYEESGQYGIKLFLKNDWSPKEITRESSVNIQSTISKMRLTVSPPNVAVDQKVDITIQLNRGSNIKVLWDFGDGTIINDQIPIVKTSQRFVKTHRYDQPGIYTIKVVAENLQGESSTVHVLTAEHPVHKNWKMTSDSPKLLPGDVKFIFSYPTDKILPTNATVILTFGDGKREIWHVPEGDWSGEHIISHEYEKPGKYNVQLNMSNVVSRVIRRFQVDVLRKITGLNVSAAYLNDERRFSSGIGLNNSRFPINKQINFTIGKESGDVEYYLIELNGNVFKNMTQNITTFKSDEPGFYNFTFYAYNHIQKNSKPFNLPLYLMEPIEGMEVFDISNDTIEPELKRFVIEFEKVGTNSCLIVDFGESRRSGLEAYGHIHNCKELFPDTKFLMAGNLTNPLEITRPYEKPRDYVLKFNVANQISSASKELTVTVIEIDCKPPNLSIRNRVTYWRNGNKFWKSKPVQLYSKTVVDCNATTIVTRVWDAFRLDDENGTIAERIDLSSLDSYRKSYLYVPPFYLKPGYYKFKYSINMTSPEPHPLLPFYASAFTYVKIVRSPIVAQLAEGAQSRVIRGWGQKIRLAPGEYSRDPDDETNKNFEVKWYCKRLPDEYINNQLPDERQNFSEPLYDRTGIDEEWDDDDGGGCFGRGPGRINVTGGEVEWNTTVFRRPGLTYEIVVQIIPPDRAPSWGALQLVLLQRKPPSIVVLCQTKALCYPHFPIGQKINPVRVGLEGKCNEGCDGELQYEWSIYGVENNTEYLLSNASYYIVGANEQKMALGIEFFQEYYPYYKDFFARLSVTNEEGVSGESDIFLHINQPPEAGECFFSPNEGMALLDKFDVKCSSWIDPEDKPIEYYAFWARSLDTGAVTYLMYGPDRSVSLILPYGNFTIGADIKDKEGAVTRINITDISTDLPTRQMYDNFMHSKNLDNADAAGDQAQMNMVTQALSSLMNARMPRNNDRPTTTSTTTTTTTTTSTQSPESDEPTEKEIEEAAKTRARMVKSVESIMNVDTLNSLEQIGSALTALAGRGKGIDNEAKEVIIKLLNKTVTMASSIQVESPQQLMDFLMFAVGTMGGIVNRMSEQLVSGVVMPTDRTKAWNLDYNVEVPDEDDEPDYILDSKTSIEDALSKAVIQSERKAGELQIRQMIELTIKLVLSMLKNIVVGEKPIEFSAPSGLSLTIAMYAKGSLSNQTIQHGDATYIFPDVCDILANRECFGNETLGTLAVSWPAILESYGNSVDLLSEDTKTLQLLVLNESLSVIEVRNATNPFSIIVPRKGSDNPEGETQSLPDPTYVIPKIKWYEQMVYHQFMIEKADSAVNIEVGPTNPESELILFIKYREKPMYDYYDILIPLRAMNSSNNGIYDIFLSNDIINNRTGFFYIGVVEVNKTAVSLSTEPFLLDEMIINQNTSSTNYTAGISNYTLPGIKRDFTTNYSMRIFTSGCYFYDYHKKIWSADGCFVESANQAMTHCKCNHLTSFGSGFFVMPNSIDFSYVFANAGFADNITIYMTIIITMTLYVILVIWARREDRKDLTKIGATPLPDNDPTSKYLYEIAVYTGDRDGAGTDSKVHFILSGDDDETEVRTFEDPNRKIFRKGAMDPFVLAVPRRLGRLNYCRIWHDNTGEGKFRSWFLSFIIVKDVQTGEKFEFICNKWLAVEKDDGSVDRLLPVAGREEATEFTHLFQQTTQKNLADGHLWFSIFMRPPRSRFTRVQRVSCCMALLYLSMLVNAMWYQRVPPKPSGSAVDFGPFSLSPEQIGVGFFSNLIVFPATFLIILLFRKSKLRTLRPSRISEALKKQNVRVRQSSAKSNGSGKLNKVGSNTTLVTIEQEAKDTFEMIGSSSKRTEKRLVKKKSKLMLPWYCRYIAWALCVLSILVSIFFLWAYGIQFGDEKTRKWITSLIISFFASILVTQPIKVFITAMILSTLFKSPDTDVDDSEEDEEELDFDLLPDEEWLHSLTPVRKKDRSRMYRPPNMTSLEKAKLQRMKELKMSAILKDIFSYLFFLWILTVISYGNRDPNAYLMKETLVKTFVEGANSGQKFMNIKNSDNLWSWSNSTLIPGIQIGDWYNGYKSYGLRGFLNDRVNRMMGYGVLRQVRVKPNTCQVEERMKRVSTECRAFSNIINEDRKSYKQGWTQESDFSYVNESLPVSRSGHLNPSRSRKDEWNYRKPSELDGLPFWGKLDVYSGGGYVIALKGSRQELSDKVKVLKKQNWIDGRTRAIFAEFSVYNAQVNLFGIVSCVVEFQPGGGIIPNFRVDVVRLMRYHQGFGFFIILCELTYVAFIVFFTIREFKNWRNQGKAYFKSYWNWAEVIIISLSYAAMVLYIYRIVLTNQILKVFNSTHGNGYVKLQYVTTIDELFGYIIAFTMFVGIIKFIRILRFNKRMGILYSTLAQCSKDLKSFCIVFCIVFFAFVQMFYLLFGLHMSDFSSFVNSAETAFGMMTGKFDFNAMSMAAPILGPLAFFVFVLIAAIVLLNIFLTLIISAFETVKHDVMKQNNEYEIVDFMIRKMKSMFGLANMNDPNGQTLDRDDGINSIEEQLTVFPEKIDRLMLYINDMYFDGKLDVNNKNAIKRMGLMHNRARVTPTQTSLNNISSERQRRRGSRGRRSRPDISQLSHPRITILDWMEVKDDDK